MQLWIYLLLGLVGPALLGFSEEGIPRGASFVSPDGRYSVELVEIDGQWRYAIKDAQTGAVDDSIVMPTVLLYLHWTADSQSIVAVEHIAKGSTGRIIYLKDGKWRDVEIRPPNDGWMEYTIINLEIKTDRAHFRFVVRHVKDNGIPIDHMFCDLDVGLATGKISNITWTSISEAQEAASLAREPTYTPSM
jgi:hypothetical protein